MDIDVFSNTIGIIGVILILIAFFFVQTGKADPQHWAPSSLNLVGAIGIMYSLLYHWNLSSVIIEAAWILISLYSVIRYFWVQKQKNNRNG